MTPRIALVLALMVIAALIADWTQWQGRATIYIAQKGLDLIDWLSFWRM